MTPIEKLLLKAKIAKKAKEIAEIIRIADTPHGDFRGNLFQEIGFELQKQSQYFTARMLLTCAENYGVNPEIE